MTVQEIVEAALGRTMELGISRPSTSASMYRRVGLRQQHLFAVAARINPDWSGTSAVAALSSSGSATLSAVLGNVAIERITKIEVNALRTSAGTRVAVGDEISVVPLDDADAFDPPRVTLRDGVIAQVGTDLADVASVRIFYSRLPQPVLPTQGDRDVELTGGHEELLVVDLTRELVRKSVRMENRSEHLALLDQEEGELLQLFTRHVAEFTRMDRRFGPPAEPPLPRTP